MRIVTIQSRHRTDSDIALPFDPANPSAFLERPLGANFGDYVVMDSMLRLINGELVGNLQFGREYSDLPKADHVVIRGSNYIRSNFDLSPLGDLIERLDVPVTVMGIGAQASEYGALELSTGTVRALRILGEHSMVVGCRGAYTAEILKQLGVDNVEPVGCPSFFRAMDRDMTIDFDSTARRAAAYNMNRHMSGIYGSRKSTINKLQRDLFLQLQLRFDVVSTFCQGEPPEFIAANKLVEHYGDLRQALVRDGFALGESDPIINDLIDSAVCARSVGDWERLIARNDFVIGMRFHGTTMGLSSGVPSVYLVNDTRIHELATHFSVPFVDVRKQKGSVSLERILDSVDFGPFNSTFADRFDRFAKYLIGNGLPSRIAPASEVEQLEYLDSELCVAPAGGTNGLRRRLGRWRRRGAQLMRRTS